jgi:hypothetical protein
MKNSSDKIVKKKLFNQQLLFLWILKCHLISPQINEIINLNFSNPQ